MRRAIVRLLVLVTAVLLAGGCTYAQKPTWPAISDMKSDVRVQGRWVWGELFADNVEAEKTFYREVFGWEFVSYGTGTGAYTLIRSNDEPIAGIIHYPKPPDVVRSARWLPLMSVPDVGRAVDMATAGGGAVLVEPMTYKGRGKAAVLSDPEGALFGVIRSADGDRPDEFPAFNTWLWMELWAKNALKMAEFYTPIGAYEASRHEGPGDRLEMHLSAKGFPRAGVLELERKDLPTTWLPYIRVQDVQKTVADITRAGGRIVVAPDPAIRNGKVAVFLDPLGAAAAVAEWKDEQVGEGKP